MSGLRDIVKIVKTANCGARFLTLLLFRSPFNILSTLINARFLQRAFNAAQIKDERGLFVACAIFGASCILLFLYNGTLWIVYSAFVVRMEKRLREILFKKISSFSYGRVQRTTSGEWFTLLNSDVQMPFSQPMHLPHAACGLVNLVVSSIILFSSSPAIFGLVILFVVPHLAANRLLITKKMPELKKRALEATARNTGELEALITCSDAIHIYDARDYLLDRFRDSSKRLIWANMKIHVRNALSSAILPVFGLGGYLTLLIVYSEYLSQGGMTFGELTALFQLRGGVLMGSMMLINSLISINISRAGIRRLNAVMEESPEEA